MFNFCLLVFISQFPYKPGVTSNTAHEATAVATAACEAKVVVGKEFNASDDNCLSILAKISKASLTP